MMKELYGRLDGLCGDKGGSMHIADMSKGMMVRTAWAAADRRLPAAPR
jgi:TPP-dependent pyruvate/acetoin dehydrogenase alpha subunit